MRRGWRWVGLLAGWCCVCFLPLKGRAQNAGGTPVAAEPSGFGTVTGHVYLAGSNAPARLVNVALQPLEVVPEAWKPGEPPAMSFRIYQTDLDGAYMISHVLPGSYYVVVTDPGYLSPFTGFTVGELAHPSSEVVQRIAAALPVVSVQPNGTSTLDVTLGRGATLSGTVRFDDGTPYSGVRFEVERHQADGSWDGTRVTADVDGHWMVSGLIAGEYRVRVNLQLSDHRESAVIGHSGSSTGRDLYTLAFYSGDTIRRDKAQAVKLEDGQLLDGEDITIPVSKLHVLSGALVDAATGKPLNGGVVDLDYAVDGSYAESATVDPETSTFTFPFMLEGQYTLRAHDAREVRLEPGTASANGDPFQAPFAPPAREVVLRRYGPAEMPLLFQGDTTGVTVPVTALAGSAPAKQGENVR